MQTKIRGNLQIQAGTILDAQIASGANIDVTKLNKTVLTPDVGTFTLTAPLVFSGDTVQLTSDPTSDNDLARKSYVDAVAAGFGPKDSCRVATTAELSATYANGSSGVGATLTGAQEVLVIDGVTLALGDRVLVKDQPSASPASDIENGIYTVTTLGVAATTAWVLTRATDFDNSPDGEVRSGNYTFIEEGTDNAGFGYTQVAFSSGDSIGTDAITFTLFSSPQSYTAGSGITLSANEFSISSSAITDAMLFDDYILTSEVDGTSIEFSGGTLNVVAGGITNAMLAGSITDEKLVSDYILTSEVDGTSIEFSGGTLNIVASGVTDAMLASDYIQTSEVDDTSIEFSGGTLNVKALGITNAMLSGSIADGKLVADYVQTSEVDNSSIEWSGTALQVKALGITDAMLAGSISDAKLSADYIQISEVDDSTIEFAGSTLNVKDAGITAAKLAPAVAGDGLTNSGSALNVTATLDDIYGNQTGATRTVNLDTSGSPLIGGTHSIDFTASVVGIVAGLLVSNTNTTSVNNSAAIAIAQSGDGVTTTGVSTTLSATADGNAYLSSQTSDLSNFLTLNLEGTSIHLQTDSNDDHTSTTKLLITQAGLAVVQNYAQYTGISPSASSYEELMDAFSGTYGGDIIPNKSYVDNAIQSAQVQIEDNGGIRDDGSGIKVDFALADDITVTNGNPTVNVSGLTSGNYYAGSQLVFLNGSLMTESTASPAYSDGDYVLDTGTGDITFEENLLTDDIVVVWYLK